MSFCNVSLSSDHNSFPVLLMEVRAEVKSRVIAGEGGNKPAMTENSGYGAGGLKGQSIPPKPSFFYSLPNDFIFISQALL